ncbi:MAG TPA: non-homologous end-joining DNA ligase [Candidatus Limnocylindria bacterium]|nr:non-homologous end-joining DNA ligase [Candidatus Limnocylindria bacterium]
MSLKEYNRKRDFSITHEPSAKVGRKAGNRFVVQKHAATRLHYDFRLEIDRRLKSWAVPKGIPMKTGEKHLAVQVEDHPIDYIDFEGTIPKGQYGGGTVMVWDTGTFEILDHTDVDQGKLHLALKGKKLKGQWHLVQMRHGKEWLLIRGAGPQKEVSQRSDDTSALSGKSMAQLGRSNRVWTSKGTTPVPAKARDPIFIEPMKARLVALPPAGDEWIFEIKFDGYRALAFKHRSEVHLLSRNQKDFATRFPEIARAVGDLASRSCVIDGEIVALDKKGRSSFQALQAADTGEARPEIYYYIFDLLELDGKSLRRHSLKDRKARLEELLTGVPDPIRYSASLEGPAGPLLSQVGKLGLEGLIAKRKDSVYESGERSGAWVKLKLRQEQEMVIGGYTEPEGSRKHFGALLIGYYQGRDLLFGGKVGTGFNAGVLKSLHEQFSQRECQGCPFANLPEPRRARYGQAVTATVMKRCHWVKPEMVCQVHFSEWTRDGKLRQPVYLGLREDRNAREVVREKAG